MIKKFFAALVVLVMVVSFGTFAMAGNVEYLRDKADILDQEAALEVLLQNATEDLGVYVVVATTNTPYDDNIEAEGRKYCYEAGLSYLEDDVVLLVINMSDRMYDLFLWGEPYGSISKKQVNSILDDMESNMRSGNYNGAVRNFISSLEDIYAENLASPDDEESDFQVYIFIAVAVGLITAGIFVGVVSLRYKMKLTPTNYPLDEFTQLELKDRDDVFLSRNVVKTVVQSSSSSGSRGGHVGGRGF